MIEVRYAIYFLKNSKSRAEFGLCMEAIKNVKELLVLPLTRLINFCVGNITFLTSLKISHTIPIYKKEDFNGVGNYRPISLLPVIFDKILKNQTVKYLKINNILPNQPFRYRVGRLTTFDYNGNYFRCY